MEQHPTQELKTQEPARQVGIVPPAVTRTAWLALALLLLACAALRVRLLDVPLERDEGEYAYMGQLLLCGEAPYAQAYSMKFPGVSYAYALIFLVFGQSVTGIHLGLLIVNAGSIVLLFLLAARLFDALTGLCAAGVFGLLSLGQNVLGFTANAEPFVLLPMLGGVLLLCRGAEQRRRGLLLAAGLLLGLSVLMKQHAAAYIAFGGILLLTERPAWRPALVNCLLVAAGATLPLAVLCAYLWARGVFAPFWFWTFTYPRHYLTMLSPDEGLRYLTVRLGAIVNSSASLWALAALGVAGLLWDRVARGRARLLLLFTAFSFLAVCPGLRFLPHYFILVLPAVSLWAGVGATALGRLVSPFLSARGTSVCLVTLAAGLTVIQQRAYLFSDSPQQVIRKAYGPGPFPEAMNVARYLEANSDPEDRVAVIGSEPEIYFYAKRRAATSFLYMYPLMEPQPYALQMQQDMITAIERAKPRFLVLVSNPGSWGRGPSSETLILAWARRYAAAHYRCIGIADIISTDLSKYRWGRDAAGYRPRSQYSLVLLERTTTP